MDLLICRLCLRGSDNPINIFECNESKSNIAQILHQHFWFELQPDDAISTVICSICWTQVSEFHQFYMSVQEAQKRYELKPVLKEETPTTPATWHEEVLLPTEALALGNANIVNPLEEDELPQTMFKKEPDELLENEFGEDLQADSKEPLADESMATSEEDDDGEENDDDDEAVIVTRSARIKKKKTKVNKKTKKKQSVPTVPKIQQYPPFCKKDEELIKRYITMACDLCLFLADNFDGIRDHFKESHNNVRPFVKCCGRKLGKRCLLVEHARKHENPEYIKCKDCGKVFANSSVLRAHWLVHHVPAEQCEFKCDQCDKRFSRAQLLELHKATHVPVQERKYVCTLCPKYNAFATDYHLQVHVSMQHRKAPNVCHVCGKGIRDKAVFEKHVRLHFEDSGPRVKCPRPNCDRWLKDEDNLKAHLRRHNDEGIEYLCQECGKNCKNKRALVSHIRYSHTNTVYTCEHCQKTFKKDISLKEHMAQHTGEPLYKCPFCPRTFNSNANMHSHKKKMHPIEWDNWRKTKRGSAQTILPSAQVSQVLRGQIDIGMMQE